MHEMVIQTLNLKTFPTRYVGNGHELAILRTKGVVGTLIKTSSRVKVLLMYKDPKKYFCGKKSRYKFFSSHFTIDALTTNQQFYTQSWQKKHVES